MKGFPHERQRYSKLQRIGVIFDIVVTYCIPKLLSISPMSMFKVFLRTLVLHILLSKIIYDIITDVYLGEFSNTYQFSVCWSLFSVSDIGVAVVDLLLWLFMFQVISLGWTL